jgi:hypothetical protein
MIRLASAASGKIGKTRHRESGCNHYDGRHQDNGEVHDRMPYIVARDDYPRGPSEEPDPHDATVFRPRRYACGLPRPGSTSRRMTILRSSCRSSCLLHRQAGSGVDAPQQKGTPSKDTHLGSQLLPHSGGFFSPGGPGVSGEGGAAAQLDLVSSM